MADLSQFDEADVVRMLWAEDPEHGGRVKLTPSQELMSDYRKWMQRACSHPERSIVAISASNGTPMYRQQYTDCGQPFGQWIAKTKITNPDSVPKVSSEKLADYERGRLRDWRSTQAEHTRQQLAASDNEYGKYLRSENWKRKREKVFQRAKGTCEGCGEQAATQVHHLTYRNVQDEFLWQLVAICDDCHRRAHPVSEQ